MSKSSEHFYDRFTFLYPVIDLLLQRQKERFFAEIDSYPHGRLLEIGVGNGSHFKYYNKHDIVGIDTSNKMLEEARKHLKSNIEVCHMDGSDLLFSNDLFDYVVLSHVIAVVPDPEQLLLEAYRTLKPDGILFILNHFTPNNGLRHIDKAFSKIAERLHFKSSFQLKDLKNLKKFELLKQINVGPLSYFQILVYRKAKTFT